MREAWEQQARQTHRGATGSPGSRGDHAGLSCTTSDVRAESVPHMGTATAREPIKPPFM